MYCSLRETLQNKSVITEIRRFFLRKMIHSASLLKGVRDVAVTKSTACDSQAVFIKKNSIQLGPVRGDAHNDAIGSI